MSHTPDEYVYTVITLVPNSITDSEGGGAKSDG